MRAQTSKNAAPTKKLKSKGFTLIELLIAMLILAVLTMLTSRAVQSAIRSKAKYQDEIEHDALVRTALKVMERDINLAFHHRDFYTEMLNQIHTENAGGGQNSGQGSGGAGQQSGPATSLGAALNNPNPNDPNAANLRKAPKELTAFVGEADSLYFTTLAHVRTLRDSPESDQAKVGYFLKNCNSLSKAGKSESSQCLWRKVSTILDDQIKEGGEESVMLDHVTSFKLRYFGPGKEDWQTDWKSDSTQDGAMSGKFPYAVEVSVKIENKSDPQFKTAQLMLVAPLRFPNNPPDKPAQPGPPGNQPPPPPGR